MKKKLNITLIEIFTLVFVVLVVFVVGAWVWNAIKLASCDFEPNYRCEVIHGSGVIIPPLSVLTVWFDDDGK